jgi:hypothetical protein
MIGGTASFYDCWRSYALLSIAWLGFMISGAARFYDNIAKFYDQWHS